MVGYNFNERFSLQFNVPLIYRSFRRPEGFAIDKGSESGFGDLSLVGLYQIVRKESDIMNFTWNAMAGLKFPTGSSSPIAEELNEEEIKGAPVSGIHGHDLTLGSGSWDAVVGSSFYWRNHRTFLTGNIQYAIRGEGDYDYRFANDLSWEAGPGYYFILDSRHTLGLQLALSGEHKGTDTFQGESAEDTGITTVYLGPKLKASWTDSLTVEAGVDFPVSIDNTALQAVPDYRLRAGLTWRF